ncbi:hypothetical protein BLNAU_17609 [Blattamonas nauphoetae]|uniref:Uncharacterized protein n=1 Tax=Blattamonas nauphoetae TaxID=2049346 RepID=A0ABQ9X6Q9_9EUKA|nr:hypothetical protein BLNAU_17609 [Blattamonas nauphoetae]
MHRSLVYPCVHSDTLRPPSDLFRYFGMDIFQLLPALSLQDTQNVHPNDVSTDVAGQELADTPSNQSFVGSPVKFGDSIILKSTYGGLFVAVQRNYTGNIASLSRSPDDSAILIKSGNPRNTEGNIISTGDQIHLFNGARGIYIIPSRFLDESTEEADINPSGNSIPPKSPFKDRYFPVNALPPCSSNILAKDTTLGFDKDQQEFITKLPLEFEEHPEYLKPSPKDIFGFLEPFDPRLFPAKFTSIPYFRNYPTNISLTDMWILEMDPTDPRLQGATSFHNLLSNFSRHAVHTYDPPNLPGARQFPPQHRQRLYRFPEADSPTGLPDLSMFLWKFMPMSDHISPDRTVSLSDTLCIAHVKSGHILQQVDYTTVGYELKISSSELRKQVKRLQIELETRTRQEEHMSEEEMEREGSRKGEETGKEETEKEETKLLELYETHNDYFSDMSEETKFLACLKQPIQHETEQSKDNGDKFMSAAGCKSWSVTTPADISLMTASECMQTLHECCADLDSFEKHLQKSFFLAQKGKYSEGELGFVIPMFPSHRILCWLQDTQSKLTSLLEVISPTLADTKHFLLQLYLFSRENKSHFIWIQDVLFSAGYINFCFRILSHVKWLFIVLGPTPANKTRTDDQAAGGETNQNPYFPFRVNRSSRHIKELLELARTLTHHVLHMLCLITLENEAAVTIIRHSQLKLVVNTKASPFSFQSWTPMNVLSEFLRIDGPGVLALLTSMFITNSKCVDTIPPSIINTLVSSTIDLPNDEVSITNAVLIARFLSRACLTPSAAAILFSDEPNHFPKMQTSLLHRQLSEHVIRTQYYAIHPFFRQVVDAGRSIASTLVGADFTTLSSTELQPTTSDHASQQSNPSSSSSLSGGQQNSTSFSSPPLTTIESNIRNQTIISHICFDVPRSDKSCFLCQYDDHRYTFGKKFDRSICLNDKDSNVREEEGVGELPHFVMTINSFLGKHYLQKYCGMDKANQTDSIGDDTQQARSRLQLRVDFFVTSLNLMTALCIGQHPSNIKRVNKAFPPFALLCIIRSDQIHPTVRQAAVSLFVHSAVLTPTHSTVSILTLFPIFSDPQNSLEPAPEAPEPEEPKLDEILNELAVRQFFAWISGMIAHSTGRSDKEENSKAVLRINRKYQPATDLSIAVRFGNCPHSKADMPQNWDESSMNDKQKQMRDAIIDKIPPHFIPFDETLSVPPTGNGKDSFVINGQNSLVSNGKMKDQITWLMEGDRLKLFQSVVQALFAFFQTDVISNKDLFTEVNRNTLFVLFAMQTLLNTSEEPRLSEKGKANEVSIRQLVVSEISDSQTTTFHDREQFMRVESLNLMVSSLFILIFGIESCDDLHRVRDFFLRERSQPSFPASIELKNVKSTLPIADALNLTNDIYLISTNPIVNRRGTLLKACEVKTNFRRAHLRCVSPFLTSEQSMTRLNRIAHNVKMHVYELPTTDVIKQLTKQLNALLELIPFRVASAVHGSSHLSDLCWVGNTPQFACIDQTILPAVVLYESSYQHLQVVQSRSSPFVFEEMSPQTDDTFEPLSFHSRFFIPPKHIVQSHFHAQIPSLLSHAIKNIPDTPANSSLFDSLYTYLTALSLSASQYQEESFFTLFVDVVPFLSTQPITRNIPASLFFLSLLGTPTIRNAIPQESISRLVDESIRVAKDREKEADNRDQRRSPTEPTRFPPLRPIITLGPAFYCELFSALLGFPSSQLNPTHTHSTPNTSTAKIILDTQSLLDLLLNNRYEIEQINDILPQISLHQQTRTGAEEDAVELQDQFVDETMHADLPHTKQIQSPLLTTLLHALSLTQAVLKVLTKPEQPQQTDHDTIFHLPTLLSNRPASLSPSDGKDTLPWILLDHLSNLFRDIAAQLNFLASLARTSIKETLPHLHRFAPVSELVLLLEHHSTELPFTVVQALLNLVNSVIPHMVVGSLNDIQHAQLARLARWTVDKAVLLSEVLCELMGLSRVKPLLTGDGSDVAFHSFQDGTFNTKQTQPTPILSVEKNKIQEYKQEDTDAGALSLKNSFLCPASLELLFGSLIPLLSSVIDLYLPALHEHWTTVGEQFFTFASSKLLPQTKEDLSSFDHLLWWKDVQAIACRALSTRLSAVVADVNLETDDNVTKLISTDFFDPFVVWTQPALYSNLTLAERVLHPTITSSPHMRATVSLFRDICTQFTVLVAALLFVGRMVKKENPYAPPLLRSEVMEDNVASVSSRPHPVNKPLDRSTGLFPSLLAQSDLYLVPRQFNRSNNLPDALQEHVDTVIHKSVAKDLPTIINSFLSFSLTLPFVSLPLEVLEKVLTFPYHFHVNSEKPESFDVGQQWKVYSNVIIPELITDSMNTKSLIPHLTTDTQQSIFIRRLVNVFPRVATEANVPLVLSLLSSVEDLIEREDSLYKRDHCRQLLFQSDFIARVVPFVSSANQIVAVAAMHTLMTFVGCNTSVLQTSPAPPLTMSAQNDTPIPALHRETVRQVCNLAEQGKFLFLELIREEIVLVHRAQLSSVDSVDDGTDPTTQNSVRPINHNYLAQGTQFIHFLLSGFNTAIQHLLAGDVHTAYSIANRDPKSPNEIVLSSSLMKIEKPNKSSEKPHPLRDVEKSKQLISDIPEPQAKIGQRDNRHSPTTLVKRPFAINFIVLFVLVLQCLVPQRHQFNRRAIQTNVFLSLVLTTLVTLVGGPNSRNSSLFIESDGLKVLGAILLSMDSRWNREHQKALLKSLQKLQTTQLSTQSHKDHAQNAVRDRDSDERTLKMKREELTCLRDNLVIECGVVHRISLLLQTLLEGSLTDAVRGMVRNDSLLLDGILLQFQTYQNLLADNVEGGQTDYDRQAQRLFHRNAQSLFRLSVTIGPEATTQSQKKLRQAMESNESASRVRELQFIEVVCEEDGRPFLTGFYFPKKPSVSFDSDLPLSTRLSDQIRHTITTWNLEDPERSDIMIDSFKRQADAENKTDEFILRTRFIRLFSPRSWRKAQTAFSFIGMTFAIVINILIIVAEFNQHDPAFVALLHRIIWYIAIVQFVWLVWRILVYVFCDYIKEVTFRIHKLRKDALDESIDTKAMSYSKRMKNNMRRVGHTINRFLRCVVTKYLLIYIYLVTFSILGLLIDVRFYCMLLFEVLTKTSATTFLIDAFARNFKLFSISLYILIIVLFIIASAIYINPRWRVKFVDEYDSGTRVPLNETLFDLFMSQIWLQLSPGDHLCELMGVSWDDLVVEIMTWLLTGVLVMNIIQASIVDAFGQIRERDESFNSLTQRKCLICLKENQDFEICARDLKLDRERILPHLEFTEYGTHPTQVPSLFTHHTLAEHNPVTYFHLYRYICSLEEDEMTGIARYLRLVFTHPDLEPTQHLPVGQSVLIARQQDLEDHPDISLAKEPNDPSHLMSSSIAPESKKLEDDEDTRRGINSAIIKLDRITDFASASLKSRPSLPFADT